MEICSVYNLLCSPKSFEICQDSFIRFLLNNNEMGENLVIVESPAKAGTIQKFLGDGYVVKSSYGHIRDLHDNSLSIDVEHNFKPDYIIPEDKKKVVADLKKEAGKASVVWLASDEDREGEAISWHLFETLGLKEENTRRIVFHEITKTAITNAIGNPRKIDMNLVDAQQARRVLDRLVGFELSPVLWRKVQPKLSAGRVQSVALRLIVDREREIMNFKRESFYRISASFHPEKSPEGTLVNAVLERKMTNLEEARKFLEQCDGAVFSIREISRKKGTRYPAAPFTTSSLQQEASRKLKFSVGLTMSLAQKLYEAGFITYMRTDSTNLSSLAINTAKKFITDNFGEEYSKPRQFKTKTKGAQEAHEAIRPTYMENTDIPGTAQEKKLYELIWKRTVASQMADAEIMKTEIKVGSDRFDDKFAISASEAIFDGFLKLYMESSDDNMSDDEEVILPEMHEGDMMFSDCISAECRFTAPPARYSEATLVKKLEELGIGRPSTYAPTISTLTKGRGYVIKGDKAGEEVRNRNLQLRDGIISETVRNEKIGVEKNRLLPQEIGMIVTDYLVNNFREILDYGFTAHVEQDFDKIAAGKLGWTDVISDFYSPFHTQVESTLRNHEYGNATRELGNDPKDGKPIYAKFGQYGAYLQKGEGEDKVYASLGPGQLIESITLEEAVRLFELPRKVGNYEGTDIICTKGKFGPYLKYGTKNISLPKGEDPMTVSLEKCIELIVKAQEKQTSNLISNFENSGIQVLNGQYGPYIKCGGKNYKLPKTCTPAGLSEEDCLRIIGESQPTEKRKRKKKL